MSMETNIILNKETIDRKMRRMALEIAERNTGESELIIAGIAGNGEAVAKKLSSILSALTGLSCQLVTVRLNKKDPKDAALDPRIDFTGRTVVLVDDVSDSGKTMLYAMRPFLEGYPGSLQTLVLVERSHKVYEPDLACKKPHGGYGQHYKKYLLYQLHITNLTLCKNRVENEYGNEYYS